MVLVVTSGNDVDVSLTTKPTDISAVPGLLREIVTGAEDLSKGDDQLRHDVLKKARALVLALQTPRETMVEHCWAQTSAMAAFNLGVDTGLWKLMAKNGPRPQKVDDLARDLGIDPVLLGRLLRHLGAMGYLHETGPDEYRPTNFTRCLSLPVIGDGYPAVLSSAKAPIMFHEYARARGWADPVDPRDSPNMFANGTDLPFFPYVQGLGYGTHFNNHMGGYRLGCARWMTDYFPVRERLIEGAAAAAGDFVVDIDVDVVDDDHHTTNGSHPAEAAVAPRTSTSPPFLVDMGGNVGHELMLFQRCFPDHPGRLILQDLPVTLGQIKTLDPAIEAMPHDLFTEQPVKGARAYFMHSILHIWPDDLCKDVLGRVRDAMTPGYSRLLINDHVVPATGAHWETSALDILMMTLHSAKERTEAQWRHLLEDVAGLRILGIWDGGRGNESLIECEVPL